MYYLRILFLILFFPLMSGAQSLQHNFELIAPNPTYKDILFMTTLQDGRLIAGLRPTGLLLSNDEGLTWQEVNYPNIKGAIMKIVQLSPDVFYGITSNSEFIKTTDGGASFSTMVLQNMDALATIADISFSDSQHGFVGVYTYKTYSWVTTDGGQTWTRIYPASDFWCNSSLMVDNSVLLLSASKRILRSTDRGHTWNTV